MRVEIAGQASRDAEVDSGFPMRPSLCLLTTPNQPPRQDTVPYFPYAYLSWPFLLADSGPWWGSLAPSPADLLRWEGKQPQQ